MSQLGIIHPDKAGGLLVAAGRRGYAGFQDFFYGLGGNGIGFVGFAVAFTFVDCSH